MTSHRMGSRVIAGTRPVVLLFVLALSLTASLAQICPTNCPILTDSANQIIVDMKCSNLGNLTQLPRSCSDSRSIKTLTIGPNSTTVNRVQGMAFSGLRIVKLVLESIGIQNIDSDAFKGLGASLEILLLDNNLLTSLPIGLFSELSILTTLQLHSNRLTSLWSVSVGNLNSLSTQPMVVASGNANATTGSFSSSLSPLISLQRLTLHDNQIEDITSDMFTSQKQLTDITLQGNRIKSLSNDTFSNFQNMETLNISHNDLTLLPNDLFTSNPLILSIDFSANKIRFISDKTFTPLSLLKELYLQNNNLSELRENTFLGLEQLVTIRLDNSNINTTYSNSLAGMPRLQELYLQDNTIREIPEGFFDQVGGLTHVNLSSNRIGLVSKNLFSSHSNLKYLDISNNKLSRIPWDWFLHTTSLDTLLLENNLISTINATSFDSTTNLREVHLTNNLLKEDQVRGRFTKCTNLQTLRLDKNPLGTITPQTFNGPPSVEHLFLNGSCIMSADFDWRPEALPLLKDLHLQNNFLERISKDAFAGLVQLTRIDLSYNELKVIEAGAFSASASTLQLLNTSQNNLDGQQLVSLAATPLNRTTVDLSWNQIKGVDMFPQFGRVLLTGNPISCSCSHFQGMSDLALFIDYDTTACVGESTSPGVQPTSQLLVCYLANSAICGNQTANVSLPTGVCGNKVNADLTTVFTRMRKEARDRETGRCDLPPPINITVEDPMPVMMYLQVTVSEQSFNLSWGVDDVRRVTGYRITWQQQDLPANVSNYVIYDVNQTHYIIDHVESKYNYTVCVQIILALNSTVKGSSKCQNVYATAGGCGLDSCKPSQQSSFMPWILYIIIPVAVVLLIIIIIIVIVVIRHQKNSQKNPTEVTSPHVASPGTISKGTNMNLPEQTTVSVNIFDY